MFTPCGVNVRGSMSLMICLGHIRAFKCSLQIFLSLIVICKNGQFWSNFALLSSFQLQFQRVKNRLGGQMSYQL